MTNEICVCGHPQSVHRTYGCIAYEGQNRGCCQCKAFRPRAPILQRVDTRNNVLPWPERQIKSA